MRYKLIENSLHDLQNIPKTILLNRGITNWKEYLNLNEGCINDYSLLENMDKAVKCLVKHLDSKSHIHIVVDSDVDGYGSASMIYRYLTHIGHNNITYSLHTRKQHGLSGDINIPETCNLVIIPDAGSNDAEQCKELKEKGLDIIILDHHICDIKNPYAVIVNNQLGNYPNKNFCGAGIVYKFLKAMDDELWESYADEMLDINALCNISDVMDMREFETRYYVGKGLNKIRSKLFKALIEKQSYSINGVVDIMAVQFYITPILNAMIRVGNQEDKDLLFRAFCEIDEIFKYKKRGEEEETNEDIYTRAARLCVNAKNRQSREVLNGVAKVKQFRETHNTNMNVLFINVTNILSETLIGLIAMKIADEYNRPCLLLRKQKSREDGIEYYGGSCRNFNNSPIESLKDFLLSTNKFEFVQGHNNAAGISIKSDNIIDAINLCNKKTKDMDFSKIYQCDFDLDVEDVDISFIKGISDIKYLFGQGVEEPLIHIKNVPIFSEEVTLMGKNLDSWKIIFNDEIAYIKFSIDVKKDMVRVALGGNNTSDCLLGYIDVVGTVGFNNYKGILTPQVIIKDYTFTPSKWLADRKIGD